MFRDLDLRLVKHFLDVTDTKGRLSKQVEDAQSRPVTEAFVNLDKVHEDLGTAGGGRLACFTAALRQAIRMFGAELEQKAIARQFRPGDRILRDDTAIVLDLDRQIVVRKNFPAEIENLAEGGCVEPVLTIIAEPCLEETDLGSIVEEAATIDEAFGDIPDFSDVIMRCDQVASGEDELWQGRRMLAQQRLKFMKFHYPDGIFPNENIVKARPVAAVCDRRTIGGLDWQAEGKWLTTI